MTCTTGKHIVDWYERCRRNLLALKENYPELSKADRLTTIRKQYLILANIDKVCRGDAYFTGVPRHTLTDTD